MLAVVAFWLAWRSPAIPLALAGLPGLITAVNGSNPLPKGGATLLIAAWVGLGVVLVMMRGQHTIAMRATLTLPVALAVFLLALLILRLGGSPGETFGSQKVQQYTADNLVFLIGAIYVGAGARNLRLFLLLSLVVIAALGLYLIFNLLAGKAVQQFSGRFEVSQQQGAISLGRNAANGALIAIALLLMQTRRAVRLLAFGSLPILLVALVAAGSRGPTVAFVIGLITLVALTAATGPARRRLLVVAAVMVGAAIVVPFVVPGSAIGRSLSTIIGSSSGLSSNGRSGLWAQAYDVFSQHIFFGIGTGGFSWLQPALLYPHNILLEVALEVGLFGLLALLAMIVLFWRRLLAVWHDATGNRQIEITLLIALFVSSIVDAMFSGAIMDNTDVWLWGGLGLGIYARRGPRRAPGAGFTNMVPGMSRV